MHTSANTSALIALNHDQPTSYSTSFPSSLTFSSHITRKLNSRQPVEAKFMQYFIRLYVLDGVELGGDVAGWAGMGRGGGGGGGGGGESARESWRN
ncbi:uncharacterized protein STEHIDRAFT_153273 [Stereum hirsutum FP-91666 SS1]|uniref:uncharacterized protein n=1 Tax=Stereum hirsutum (strain FP-91666) TaxID=721885 RepID=UPI00044102F2|nr:uncharacterized protein STEHIDRAFT_153273 [Stereum hirsutum FP-91666 SS1]EIM91649.1 hypothetical protein STEHIDRAFT_153273 [Stereum hirsutum FP-91666 SS1]